MANWVWQLSSWPSFTWRPSTIDEALLRLSLAKHMGFRAGLWFCIRAVFYIRCVIAPHCYIKFNKMFLVKNKGDNMLGKMMSMLRGKGNFELATKQAPNEIGVYIFKLDGRAVYVGRAIECRPGQSPSGLRKRLQEHWRGAAAGNKNIYQYRDKIGVSIRKCSSVEEAKALEARLIRQYDTVANGWNQRYED